MKKFKINKSSKESISKSLVNIAEDLISNTVITINESVYSFVDIEMYYWHYLHHQDEYAKSIEHNRPVGEFEIHQYGVDLSLDNSKESRGGILIRGLYDEKNKTVIHKPRVVRTLYNQINQGDNKFELVTQQTDWSKVFRSSRINLGNVDTDNKKEFKNEKYRFLAADKMIFQSYPGKEAILRNSDLVVSEIEEMLGYKILRH